MANTSRAVDKVFDTPELLEAVLEIVDMQTLLLSQRVNKAFKDTIKASIRLGCLLWFKPMTEFQIEALEDRRNPLIIEFASKLNLKDLYPKPHPTREAHPCVAVHFLDTPVTLPGSWQRMLPFQPYANRDYSIVRINDKIRTPRDTIHARCLNLGSFVMKPNGCPDGLTMGVVVDFVDDWCQRHGW